MSQKRLVTAGRTLLVGPLTLLVVAVAMASFADAASANANPSISITTVPSTVTVLKPYKIKVSGYSGRFKDLFLLTGVSDLGCGSNPGGAFGSPNVNRPDGNAYFVPVKEHQGFSHTFHDELALSGSQLICAYLTLSSKPSFDGYTFHWGKTFHKTHALTVKDG